MLKIRSASLLCGACLWALAVASVQRCDAAEGPAKAAGVRGGICVLLGATDGRELASLGAGGRLLVHGLADDDATVAKVRAHLRAAKLCGTVSVERGSFKRLPYADNLVNLVVVSDAPGLMAKGLALGEVVRVLAPGGVACLGKISIASVKPKLNGLSRGVSVSQSGKWVALRKKRLPGTDEWTHSRYGPSGNAVSSDEVGVPRSVRWQAGPLYQTGGHYYGGGAPVSAGGRIFNVVLEEQRGKLGTVQKQVLWCRDAHNGLLLWKRANATRYAERKPLVVAGNRLYTVLERVGGSRSKICGPLLALDAATGKTVKAYDAAINPAGWMFYAGRLTVRKSSKGGALLSLDPSSGAVKWRKKVQVARMIAAGGKIYCLSVGDKGARNVFCLDAGSGAEKWRAGAKSEWGRLLCHFEDVLIFVSQIRGGRKTAAGVHGVSAKDGKHLWSFQYGLLGHGGRPSKVYCINGLVWVNRSKPSGWVGLNPGTGKEDKFLKEAAPCWSRNLCADNRATKRFILSRTMLFVDVKTGKYLRPWGVKNGCGNASILPANGLIYTFPHQCRCYPMLRGHLGLAPKLPPLPAGGKLPRKLERGPVWGSIRNSQSAVRNKDDWRTYRADSRRSGSANSAVPGDAKKLWEVDFGGEIPVNLASEWRRRGGGLVSAATAAAGRVFVALPDRHRVLALDAAKGSEIWSYTAGGRVDTPPTIHGGLCLFGSSDGWVYCLRAADGKLVWRFRAAPAEWKICVFGQLESAWPVHGSVLVEGGVAYIAAGRHTHFDGGGFLYALDPASGKVLWAKGTMNYHGLIDLMLSNGKSIGFAARHYERHRKGSGQFDPKTGTELSAKQATNEFLRSNTGLLSEMWLHRVYKGSRLSLWTAGKRSAQKLVLNGKAAIGFHVGYKAPARLVKYSGASAKPEWSVDLTRSAKLPARQVKAIALTGNVVWAAGRMAKDSNDPVLSAYSAKNGSKLGEHKLPAPVTNDGIAAAGGRLYVSLVDGRVLCFGSR